jgi:hypothetical protein
VFRPWAKGRPKLAHIENADDAAKLLLSLTGSVAAAHEVITRNKGFLDKGSPDAFCLAIILADIESERLTFGAAARRLARRLLDRPTAEQEEAFIKKLRRLSRKKALARKLRARRDKTRRAR